MLFRTTTTALQRRVCLSSRLLSRQSPHRQWSAVAGLTSLSVDTRSVLVQSPTTRRRTSDTLVRFLSTEASSKDTSEDEQTKTTTQDDNVIVDDDDEPVRHKNMPHKPKETIAFKAETRKILDIMINSIYTDKEVFLRELVSNASDALEKLRHAQAANTISAAYNDNSIPNEIRIELDEVTSTITVTDTGVGMTREDMVANLGTIAKSGSKQFMEDLKRVDAGEEIDPGKGIIGRFGVGFYSVFMVAERVEVWSRSAYEEHKDMKPQKWSSDGNGFEVEDVDESIRVGRGTTIKLWMDSAWWKFVNEKKLEEILMRYSNFIGFPIYLMGRKVNTVQAIWTRSPKEVPDEDYIAFYRYIANAVDAPLDTIHFRAEAPLDVKALFYIPSFHNEKFGQGRMQPSVSLYCRRVLIEAKSRDILPDWLRFLKGVVDSEDLPLSISREKPQDSNLIKKLRKALTRKFISHLTKMQKDDEDAYLNEFFKEYGYFLKEGVCHDTDFAASLAKLLYFDSSKNDSTKLITFDEYISNMRPEQSDIYYLCAPTRESALSSPYMETFDKANIEVLITPTAIDDFVMGSLKTYEGRKLVSIESSDVDLTSFIQKRREDNPYEDLDEGEELYKSDRKLSDLDAVEFCNWVRVEMKDEVASCSVSNRLFTSPAIVTDHESGAVRRMMKMVDTTAGGTRKEELPLPKQHVEVNPAHPLIVGIHEMRTTSPTLAKALLAQVYDNCLVAAGLMDDGRTMIPRLNDLLITLVQGAQQQKPKPNAKPRQEQPSASSSTKTKEPKKPQPVEAEVILPPSQSKTFTSDRK